MRSSERGDAGQMLLASGLVLMLSLLSMAWYGVSVAGLGEPYDGGSREVLDTSRDVIVVWQLSLIHISEPTRPY